MSARTFVDTSVLLRVYDEVQPRKRARAKEVIAALQAGGPPTVSANVLGELFNGLVSPYLHRGRKMPPMMSRDEATGRMDFVLAFRTVSTTPEDIREALRLRKQYSFDWWDGVNHASAKAAGCDRVLTENVPSASTIEGIRYENPFDGIVEDGESGA